MAYANNMVVRLDAEKDVHVKEGLATIALQYVLENGLGCLADLETPAFVRRLWNERGGLARIAS